MKSTLTLTLTLSITITILSLLTSSTNTQSITKDSIIVNALNELVAISINDKIININNIANRNNSAVFKTIELPDKLKVGDEVSIVASIQGNFSYFNQPAIIAAIKYTINNRQAVISTTLSNFICNDNAPVKFGSLLTSGKVNPLLGQGINADYISSSQLGDRRIECKTVIPKENQKESSIDITSSLCVPSGLSNVNIGLPSIRILFKCEIKNKKGVTLLQDEFDDLMLNRQVEIDFDEDYSFTYYSVRKYIMIEFSFGDLNVRQQSVYYDVEKERIVLVSKKVLKNK